MMSEERNNCFIKKITKYVLPIMFFGFLLFLMLTVILRIPNKNTINESSIKLYPNEITISSMADGSFQSAFSSWIETNFYGYPFFIKLNNEISYNIFNDGYGEWIQGRNKFIYNRSQSLDYVTGEKYSSTYENILNDVKSLYEIQTLLKEQGKDFIFLLTPTKAEIYPDYLPWYFDILTKKYANTENNNHQKLIRALEECGVNYYDVTKDLKEMRSTVDFDIFSKTGHHWTLTATALEMNTMFKHFEEMTCNTIFPEINVIEINDNIYSTDQDIINSEVVFYPELADKYYSPIIENTHSDSSVFMFGTSYGCQIVDALNNSQNEYPFNNFTYSNYFTNIHIYDSNGYKKITCKEVNDLDDIGIMNYIRNANLIILEHNALLGMSMPHYRFIDYVKQSLLNKCSVIESFIKDDSASATYELQNFYDLESWGRWSRGTRASINMQKELKIKDDEKLFVKMDVKAYDIQQNVQIIWNDKLIKTLQISTNRNEYIIEVPNECISDNNTLLFELSQTTLSPKEKGYSDDDRKLGLGFYSLKLLVRGVE